MGRPMLAAAVLCSLAAGGASAYDPARYVKLANRDPAAPNEQCKKVPPGLQHKVPPRPENGLWGYLADGMVPVATVRSGDSVSLTVPTASATFAYEDMVEGDPELEALFRWDHNGPAVATRGAVGGGEGRNWNVGPIHVCSAKPGDVLQVEIVSLKPRLRPSDNQSYAVLCANSAGYHNRDGGDKSDIITVFGNRVSPSGNLAYVMPEYQYNWESREVTTSCVPDEAEYPNTLPDAAAKWTNKERRYNGVKVPCVNGRQTWGDMSSYPGQPVNVPYEERTFGLAARFTTVPHLHLGLVGVAPGEGRPVADTAPGAFGGNLDQKRLGEGASVYLPVAVKGAQLFVGDPHFAQSDGQFSGCALDGHVEATVRVTVHKRKEKGTPKWMRTLTAPVIETNSSWVITGLALPAGAPSAPAKDAAAAAAAARDAADLNRAMAAASKAATAFLKGINDLDESEAVRFLSFGADFGVTQLTNGNVGVHAELRKEALNFFDTVSAAESAIKAEELAAAAAETEAEEAAAAAAAGAEAKDEL